MHGGKELGLPREKRKHEPVTAMGVFGMFSDVCECSGSVLFTRVDGVDWVATEWHVIDEKLSPSRVGGLQRARLTW